MPKHGMSFELFLTQILPPIGVINVSSKFDHHEVPNTLVLNLATRWPNKCLYHRQKSYWEEKGIKEVLQTSSVCRVCRYEVDKDRCGSDMGPMKIYTF